LKTAESAEPIFRLPSTTAIALRERFEHCRFKKPQTLRLKAKMGLNLYERSRGPVRQDQGVSQAIHLVLSGFNEISDDSTVLATDDPSGKF
jgi:hypothetical protein